MGYQLTELLLKCNEADYDLLIKQIDSYVNLSSDKELKQLLDSYIEDKSEERKLALAKILEREIRYIGSSEIAYAYRKIIKNEELAGVDVHEIINDVSKKLKLKQRKIGSLEAKIERLVKANVERTFFKMTPDQQRELFNKSGVSVDHQDEILTRLKQNKAQFLPILLSVLGPKVTMTLVQTIAVSALAAFIGRKAAEELIKNILARFPWFANILGPVVWGVSLSWLAIDLQSAAYRKTIPVLMYLGIVALRDGPEDGEDFWSESAEA